VTAALQAVLAAQHAAVFSYARIGTGLTDPRQIQQAHELQAAHRVVRDETMAQLAARGVTPLPAQASYPAPGPLGGPKDAQDWALSLEQDCGRGYRYLLTEAATSGAPASLRSAALAALVDSATICLYWRALLTPVTPTQAFPGT
jgi:hypothetical protein